MRHSATVNIIQRSIFPGGSGVLNLHSTQMHHHMVAQHNSVSLVSSQSPAAIVKQPWCTLLPKLQVTESNILYNLTAAAQLVLQSYGHQSLMKEGERCSKTYAST